MSLNGCADSSNAQKGFSLLSVGLHSYGFTQSASFWLMIFVLSQLGIIVFGLIPLRLWRSRSA